jgi:hypothetical protein
VHTYQLQQRHAGCAPEGLRVPGQYAIVSTQLQRVATFEDTTRGYCYALAIGEPVGER